MIRRTPATVAHRRGGFTLIELAVGLVVMTIVITVVGVSVRNIARADLAKDASILAGGMRYLYNLAVINNTAYRLVIDIDGGMFWGEALTSTDPCDAYLADDEDLRDGKGGRGGRGSDDDDEEPDMDAAKGFGKVKDNLLSERKLARDVLVTAAITSHHQEAQQSGRVAIHFFPGGEAERAYIWLGQKPTSDSEDAEADYTVELSGSLGRVTAHSKALDEQDFFKEVGERR